RSALIAPPNGQSAQRLQRTLAAAAMRTSAELRSQFVGDLEHVSNDSVASHAEDRGLRILVDGNDVGDVLHAGEVLHRAGDAHGDVDLAGTDGFAGLADLPVLRQPAVVRDRT